MYRRPIDSIRLISDQHKLGYFSVNSFIYHAYKFVHHKTNHSYPRATRCGGDIVMLLWFRPSVAPSVRPCVDLVNTTETTSLHVSLSNLADKLTMMRG